MRLRRHRPLILFALAALVLALPSAAAAKKPPPPPQAPSTVSAYGLGSLSAEWQADTPLGLDDLGRMGSAKLGTYRARFRQDEVLSNGSYSNWVHLDNLTKQASLRGVTLVPVLMNLPGETYTPPRTTTERDAFASFAAAAARRYGPSGTFWSSCGCPWRPVQVWEVWNEPNFAQYWGPPSATEYAALLQVVRSRVRAADSKARIMFGGLAYAGSYDGVNSINPNTFLRGVIQAAGVNAFDALAIHDYHSNASSGVTAVGGTVNVLKQYAGTDASGAPRQQVWINEYGKATALDNPATTTDEAAQSEVTQRSWLEPSRTACSRTAPPGTWGRCSGTRSATPTTQMPPGCGWASAAPPRTTRTVDRSWPGTTTWLTAARRPSCRCRSSARPSRGLGSTERRCSCRP